MKSAPHPIRIQFKTAFEIVWNKLEQADPAFLKHPDAKAVLSHWLLAPEVRPPLLPAIFEDEEFVAELKSAIVEATSSSSPHQSDFPISRLNSAHQ